MTWKMSIRIFEIFAKKTSKFLCMQWLYLKREWTMEIVAGQYIVYPYQIYGGCNDLDIYCLYLEHLLLLFIPISISSNFIEMVGGKPIKPPNKYVSL